MTQVDSSGENEKKMPMAFHSTTLEDTFSFSFPVATRGTDAKIGFNKERFLDELRSELR